MGLLPLTLMPMASWALLNTVAHRARSRLVSLTARSRQFLEPVPRISLTPRILRLSICSSKP